MKRVVLFAAIVAASAGNLPGSPEQSSPAHKQEVAQQAPANPSPVTVVIENAQRSEPAQPSKPKSPKGYTPPEGTLVFVGIVTCLVIMWQAWETRKSAEAMKASIPLQRQAAEAALLNAQAVINSERPWVMIQIQESMVSREKTNEGISDLRSFRFSIFNYGKSPAHILNCKMLFDVLDNPDKTLPIPPDYGTDEWRKRFLAPHDSFPISAEIYPSNMKLTISAQSADRGKGLRHGELVTYGLIEYSDGISTSAYKTAFCYRHEKGLLSSMGGHFVPCGPEVYNSYS